jgi:hypothetical protein
MFEATEFYTAIALILLLCFCVFNGLMIMYVKDRLNKLSDNIEKSQTTEIVKWIHNLPENEEIDQEEE